MDQTLRIHNNNGFPWLITVGTVLVSKQVDGRTFGTILSHLPILQPPLSPSNQQFAKANSLPAMDPHRYRKERKKMEKRKGGDGMLKRKGGDQMLYNRNSTLVSL